MPRLLLFLSLMLSAMPLVAQRERVQRMPYADHYRYYVGLQVGSVVGGISLQNKGYTPSEGKGLYAEQAAYRLGLNIGITGGMVLRPNWELRLMPTLSLGDLSIAYSDGSRVLEHQSLSHSSLTLPIQIKWASWRLGNVRPYVALGPYASWHFSGKREDALRHHTWSFGLQGSIGCDLYLGFVKMSPELSYRYGLSPALQLHRPELQGDSRLRYSSAIGGSRGHQITLSLHFQ